MKNFDEWNKKKKNINDSNKWAPVKLGEIYWCYFGINIGVEQDGKSEDFQRPVIVIKKFSNQIVLVAPLTTKFHKGDWYLDCNILSIRQQIILNQIKPIDTKRLIESMGEISKKEILNILESYWKLIKK